MNGSHRSDDEMLADALWRLAEVLDGQEASNALLKSFMAKLMDEAERLLLVQAEDTAAENGRFAFSHQLDEAAK